MATTTTASTSSSTAPTAANNMANDAAQQSKSPRSSEVIEANQNNNNNNNSSTNLLVNVTKRLQSELMALMMSPSEGINAFPESDADLTLWRGSIEGAEGTYYEGQEYAISLSFPSSYPYSAPTVRFESVCFHPNVDLHGNICLDILKEKWSPMLSVATILISIQSLLGEPNNNSPLNVEATDLWDNPVAYKKELAKHYKPIEEEE